MVHSIRDQSVTVALVVFAVSACTPVSQDQVRPEAFADPPTISQDAAAMYGDRAQEAYDHVSDFLLEHSTPAELLAPDGEQPTEATLTDGIVDQMTASAAIQWESDVVAAIGGDTEALEVVNLLCFYDLDTTDATPPRDGDVLGSQSVSEGVISLGETTDAAATTGDDAAATSGTAVTPLQVSLVHQAQIRLEEDRVPYQVEVVRPLTLTLVPDGDGWLISDFSGELQTRTIVGDPPTVVDDSSTSDDSATTTGR